MTLRAMMSRHAGFVAGVAALACVGALLAPTPVWAQSRESGAVNGLVTDEQGGVLPGVTVTLASPSLGTSHEAVTGQGGQYRFVAIQPSIYTVTATMSGFSSARQTDVRLTVGRTLRVNLQLAVGGIEEVIEVEGIAPLIDAQDSQQATTQLENEILMNIPTNKTIRGIVNLTPGVWTSEPGENSFSAFGSSDQGIQYQVDGVVINSPEAGEVEVNLDFDSVNDVTVLGLGAPAEYGGYSGVIVNSTVKSGTNQFHGLFDAYTEQGSWQSENTTDEDLQRGGLNTDRYNVHFNLGGPITKDKLWFFVSAKYLSEESPRDPGHNGDPSETEPRIVGKVTWSPSQKQRLSAMIEYSDRDSRFIGADDGAFFAPGTTFDNVQKQYFYNANYTNIFSDTTFLEAKFGGYHQRQEELSESGTTTRARFDEVEDKLFDNWFGPFVANRERYQLLVSVSHFADDFIKGSHNFKFGAEAERSPVRTKLGYNGGGYYITRGGEPYLRYDTLGYDTTATTKRLSAYVQDSWSISPRVRINWGLRLGFWRGDIGGTQEQSDSVGREFDPPGTVFKPKVGLAPRLGVTIDLAEDQSAVLKAHYGKYYHQVTSLFYSRLGGGASDFSLLEWNGEEYELLFTEVRDNDQFTIDPDLKVPYMQNFSVGIEKALAQDLAVDVTGVYRSNHDLLDKVNTTGEFEEIQYTDEFTGQTYTVQNQLNPGENLFFYTNPEEGADYGQAYRPITNFNNERKYVGVTASLNKRWSNNWQAQVSYTWGKATGSDNNILMEFGEGRSSSLGASDFFTDPNSQINAKGNLTIDPTHLVKVVASAELPYEFIVGGFFSYFTGNTYNQFIPVFDVEQQSDIYGVEAGSFRQPNGANLDLKIEKLFTFGGDKRVSVLADIFNVFNAATGVESEQSVDSDRAFGTITRLVRPRRLRLGVRFRF